MKRSLKPLVELVGEVIFVDTGSDDESINLASRYGAKIIKTKWEADFSAARNVYLEHAKRQWILALDSDEILLPDDLIKLSHELNLTEKSGVWFTVRHYCNDTGKSNWTYGFPDPKLEIDARGYAQTRNVKLFPNYYGISYRYPLHESVLPDLLEREIQMAESPVVIHHLGLLNLDVNSRNKRIERNMRLGYKKIKLYPNDACGFIELADLILEYGKPETAIKLLKQAVTLAPGYPEAYNRLAGALEKNDQTDEALTIYKKLAEAEPVNPVYNASLGRLIYEQGNYEEAEYYLARAKNYFSYVRLAFARFYTKKYTEALQAARKAVSINPDRCEAKIILKRIELEVKKSIDLNSPSSSIIKV